MGRPSGRPEAVVAAYTPCPWSLSEDGVQVDGGVDLEQGLPYIIGLADPSDLHGADSRPRLVEAGPERRSVAVQVCCTVARRIRRGSVGLDPCHLDGKRCSGRRRTSVIAQAAAHVARPADVEWPIWLAEEVHAGFPGGHGGGNLVKTKRVHLNQRPECRLDGVDGGSEVAHSAAPVLDWRGIGAHLAKRAFVEHVPIVEPSPRSDPRRGERSRPVRRRLQASDDIACEVVGKMRGGPDTLNAKSFILKDLQQDGGGESGIRTHGRVSPTHAFQACSFNRSDISPGTRLARSRKPVYHGVHAACGRPGAGRVRRRRAALGPGTCGRP